MNSPTCFFEKKNREKEKIYITVTCSCHQTNFLFFVFIKNLPTLQREQRSTLKDDDYSLFGMNLDLWPTFCWKQLLFFLSKHVRTENGSGSGGEKIKEKSSLLVKLTTAKQTAFGTTLVPSEIFRRRHEGINSFNEPGCRTNPLSSWAEGDPWNNTRQHRRPPGSRAAPPLPRFGSM